LGVLALSEAIELARDRGLDLVEVAPNSQPPVCRLLDYGRFLYMQTKKEKEAKKSQKINLVRQIRMRTRISSNDMLAKQKLVRKFLQQGIKVKVSVLFRGREITHPDIGINILKRMAEAVEDQAKLEQVPNMEGRMLSIVLAPIPAAAKKQETKKETEEQVNAQDENT